MPATDKTPASSRRFLPPSSSASSKQWTSSGRKPAFAQSQSTFTPSSTSRIAQVSRFETPAKAELEDIDIGFGDGDSSPLGSIRRAHTPDVAFDNDVIDEDDTRGSQNSTDRLQTVPKRRSLSIEASPNSPVAGAQNRASSDLRDYVGSSTPLPKRRKLSTSSILRSRDVVGVSSSSEGEESPISISNDHQLGGFEGRTTFNDIERQYSPELVTPTMPTRFKNSLIKTDTMHKAQQQPSFRPFAKDCHLNAVAEHALPDAFSPSRRKGKKTYEAGGLADTVRNWVLNVAAEESQLKRAEETVKLRSAVMDQSGRAIIANDEDGSRWILVGDQPAGHAGGSTSTLSRLRKGAMLTIRGTSTNWSLPAFDSKRETCVAAQWDVG